MFNGVATAIDQDKFRNLFVKVYRQDERGQRKQPPSNPMKDSTRAEPLGAERSNAGAVALYRVQRLEEHVHCHHQAATSSPGCHVVTRLPSGIRALGGGGCGRGE